MAQTASMKKYHTRQTVARTSNVEVIFYRKRRVSHQESENEISERDRVRVLFQAQTKTREGEKKTEREALKTQKV